MTSLLGKTKYALAFLLVILAANLLIAAMKQADSADPAKYLPALAKTSFMGSSGRLEFDDKGDRKDAEMTIFTMKAGKLEPIAIVKGGKTMSYAEFIKGMSASAKSAKKK